MHLPRFLEAVSFFADEEIIIIFVDYDFYNNTKIIIA